MLLVQFSKHLLCCKLPTRPPVGLYFIQVKEGNKLSCLKQKSPRFRTLHQRRTMPLTGQDFVLQDYTHVINGLRVGWVQVILFASIH